MSKSYWVKDFSRCLLGFGLLAEPLGALAQQGALTGRAVVYQVPARGEAARFQVPQVRLANTVAAQRINRLLLRVTLDVVDSTASPQRQLYQAARECCYDQETKSWRAGGDGLTGTGYRVLLNQDFLLSLAFSHEYGGLEWPGGSYLTFDLRTGRCLTLADLLIDPPAELNRRLAGAINRRLRADLADVAANYGDLATIDRVAQLYGFYGVDEWNTTPQHQPAADTAASVPPARQTYPADFALQPNALLLFFSVGMARVEFEFLPDDTYVFPYSRLHPRGLLVAVAKKAKQRNPRRVR